MKLLEKSALAVLLVIAVAIGLQQMATPAQNDAAIEAPAAQLLPVIRAQRARIDSIERVKDSLGRRADLLGSRYVAAKAQRDARFGIGVTLPKPSLTIATDTTQLLELVRLTDSTKFLVPREFVEGVTLQLQLADSAYLAGRLARVYLEDFVVPAKDTLITHLDDLAIARRNEAAYWKKKANPRCGTKCKVLAGAGAGELLRRLLKSWVSK